MTIRLLFSMLWTVLCLTACRPEPWERDPDVEAAKKACKVLDQGEDYDCVERHAVETLNPDVCRLVGIWIDDMCLQAVYEAADDPAICERLYLEGVRPTCRAYYAQALAPMRHYTDSALGFAAEVPSNWEIGDRTQTLDPLGRPWSSVEFRSELYAYGHEAFNRYGIRVQAGPGLASTLTETVQLGLSSMIPGFRDQVQVHCCLTVGGEQAMELLNYPPTRWGNRQIVVLHEEREPPRQRALGRRLRSRPFSAPSLSFPSRSRLCRLLPPLRRFRHRVRRQRGSRSFAPGHVQSFYRCALDDQMLHRCREVRAFRQSRLRAICHRRP
jgi:hypothetical protein